ncbi:Acetyltransferase (GNAT) family protein [Aquimarina amphilecti]|uniref:Acetyltransferase (GNAT) family protein n=1 Tax=Aquimarina amphilecti TaxID=1038014 RepID=A0A1H7VBF6_AQUAM|nr:GNAT family N-acetyltransferase [Aquimarina amphilecti]SEM06235.1 Acetyltransferase (GNAT) family protein [Aquimarina amphilecti]
MDYIIRDAVVGDMPQVLTLIEELALFEKEPDAVDVTVEDLIKEGFGEKPLFHCFVAEINNELVGLALVYFRFSTWKGRTVHLEDLIVRESMRGSGIGMALYKRVMKYGMEKGVKRVEWNVLDWNKPAVNFYLKSGAKILEGWQVVQMDEHGLNAFVSKM